MKLRRFFLLLGSLPVLFFGPFKSLVAAPPNPETLPEPLKPWIGWVLKDHERERCPYLQGAGEVRFCAWGGRLDLSLESKSGRFTQGWRVYADEWVTLPGDKDRWPQEVKANGQPVAVVARDGMPSLFLKPGQYTVTGSFAWDRLPESFPLPRQIGLLQLTVEGQPKPFPQLDENGLVWLKREIEEGLREDTLELRVNRKLTDDIPFLLTTQLTLNVSGSTREIVLEKVLLDEFVAMSIKSPIPTRIEKDGKFRAQVKPGNWKIEIEARHLGPVNSLTLPEAAEPWPKEEIWVFDARPDLRLVWIEGVPSIDPQQTTLPEEWKQLPAYRVTPGDSFKLVEKRRGDSDPAPDQLTLHRQWWLDFNGAGFTLHDEIGGTLSRSWRLEMNPPVQLGRIAVDGTDQFITRLPGEKKLGVEIRQGSINVSADSRIDQKLRRVPAVGWNNDFQSVSGEINLPPGWTLFAVSGADDVPNTWINRWSLLDIFLVLVTALTFFKLWGWRWGALALLTFALTFPEHDAPKWIWLALLAGLALLRVLPKGKFHTLFRFYRAATLLILIAFSIPFMIHQIRIGMYPALEHEYGGFDLARQVPPPPAPMGAGTTALPPTQPVPQALQMQDSEQAMDKAAAPMEAEERGKVYRMAKKMKVSEERKGYDAKQMMNLQEQRPGTKVQTGPGLPRWEWNRIALTWNGPVEKTQMLRFFLIGPWANLVLAFLRVGLLLFLLRCVLEIPWEFWRRYFRPRAGLALILLGFGAGMMGNLPAARADIPTPELLTQLQERLLENPECFPECASISRLQLQVSPGELTGRLEINLLAHAAVPLPGSATEWLPHQVSVDGQPFPGVIRENEGQLFLELPPGVHQVQFAGPLPEQETVQIALPLKPHRAEVQSSGWSLEGIRQDGTVEDAIQLTRLQQSPETQGSTQTIQGGLVPFVVVERELLLGLNWEVTTRVRRITPTGAPISLKVPLLKGESVITPEVRVEASSVLASLGPNATDLEWRSTLVETPDIELKAPEALTSMEIWKLDVSPVWHVDFAGIPKVHPSEPGKWSPEWRPWPGESLKIKVSRPEGVPGQTLTIDQSRLLITPGIRFTEAELSLTIRSSLGGQHVLTLPQGSQLQSVIINQNVQPIRLDQGKVTLPIVPGLQTVALKFQLSGGIGIFFKAPSVDLGAPSVNSEIHFAMPRNRWTLLLGGPRLGPAVLFWSVLAVILIFAFGLSRLTAAPVRTYEWLLLGLGITQFPEYPVLASLFVAGWLLSLAWRQRKTEMPAIWFDLRQIFLAFYTLAAVIVLFVAIHQGLLGSPEMQIRGNGSNPFLLRWFQDRSPGTLSRPWVFSLPLFAYRLAMLAWALWIAWTLLGWLKWAWRAFSTSGLWRPLGILRKKPT